MVFELRHGIASWTQKYIGGLIRQDRKSGLAVLDAIISRYRVADPAALGSSVGSVRIGGVVQEKSEASLMKAINAPAGKLCQAVLSFLGEPKRRSKMPHWIAARFETLLELPGDGAGHAACLIARQFRWFDYWFTDWAAGLLPLFALDHPLAEAMWHGLASDPNFIGDDAGKRIKPALMAVLAGGAAWELDDDARKRLIGLMVNLTLRRDGKPAVISFAEARRLLIAVGDGDRAEALAILARSKHSDDLWASLIRPFLLFAWPRQLKYQTAESARQLVQIAEKSGDRFPEIAALILPFLRPVPHLDTIAYRLQKQGEGGQGYSVRFPSETLGLLNALVGDDPQALPWNLGELLELVADAAPALRQSDPWRRLKAFTQ
ncbi:MAG: hypothetical protein H0W74_13900 [Sphingosinicella sp.]|nr:hypothetical protein [Sphingosinicella sp.]